MYTNFLINQQMVRVKVIKPVWIEGKDNVKKEVSCN